MNFFTFGKLGRTLLMAAVLVVGTVAAQTGTLTDSRDGQKYKTVKIGNQVWMAENLRFKIGDSWCYENSDENCNKYGRLYNWNMAKFACPKGGHLPSKNEWTELVTVVGFKTGGKELKSTSGWNENGGGTDEYGFSALPGGFRRAHGSFYHAGDYGYWWTATEHSGDYAYRRDMHYGHDNVDENYNVKGEGYSVRCVKDRSGVR